ncbi:hypothetical protein BJV77DRAFT_1058302 [Russula vinacea]|nr:hypothetical protein BJV77DRAFT_1058302 [Russula vinacea]
MAAGRLPMDSKRSLIVDPEPNRTKKLLKYVVSLGLLWYILHRWLFAFNSTTHDRYPWALDAFAPEELFLSTIPNSASATVASRRYATSPHLAGSEEDLRTAKDFLDTLKHELCIPKGIEYPIYPAGSEASRNATLSITNLTQPTAWIDVYYPVLNTPLNRSLEIIGDDGTAVWKADLEEAADELDGDAHAHANSVGAWHGLSYDGEAEGRLIYANYGRKRDYDQLVEKGVDFTGAIVIVRYGGVFRGLKVKGAQELGAAGVLIYSDPQDDGMVTEKNGYAAYPHGPARNPTSVQRGSVQFISMYPGDPTTPGYPSYENSTRTNGSSIPSIPAYLFLGQTPKSYWRKLRDRTGQSSSLIMVTPIWNPIGVIPGHIKNEVVLVGNHRDAWVMGAADPSSGTVAVHEVIQDWKPLRTIVIASWDAEEYGLIGSTEWGEDFADWIQKYVVAYVNLDTAVSGSTFGAAGSPLLAHFIRKTAEDLPHPTDPRRTLWDATTDRGKLFGEYDDIDSVGTEVETQAADSVGIRPLGSGSDYTVFLQRLGVASMDSGGFHSTRSDPVYHYHSVFDSERFQEVYADPGFVKHVSVAKNLGLQTLRLSSALILPFNTTHYAFELENYLDRVEGLAAASSATVNFAPLRAAIRTLQFASFNLDAEKFAAERVLRGQLRKLRKHQRKHKGKDGCQKRFLRRLKGFFTEESNDVTASTLKFGNDHEIDVENRSWPRFPLPRRPKQPHRLPPKFIKALDAVLKINQKLASFERGFIHEDGIKDREWYRHLGVAPGKWLGYGATTLPALTEAITIEKNVTLANYEVIRLTERLEMIASVLRA